MKALTVWQPWASLIAIGAKPFEFRSWKPPTSLIGQRIAIHAAARPVKMSEVRGLIRALSDTSGFTNPCLVKPIALPFLESILESLKASPDTLFNTPAAHAVLYSHVVCTAIVGTPLPGDEVARAFGARNGREPDQQFNWGWPMLHIEPLSPPEPARGFQGLWDFQKRIGTVD